MSNDGRRSVMYIRVSVLGQEGGQFVRVAAERVLEVS